jgi:hypothetical protein
MTTLEHEGAGKGNFTKRLADALTALEHVEQQKSKTAGNKHDLICDVSKQNPRNMGMI